MRLPVLLAMIALSLRSCAFAPSCEDTIKNEVKSPDGKYIATLYERDCGATTDFSTIVNLRSASAKFDAEEGRIFVVKGQPNLKLAWEGNSKLRLECSGCHPEDVFKQEKTWRVITIDHLSYER